MLGRRTGECPSCGAPVEFKLGSSGACVCGYCRASLVRTDRDLRSLGKVAELVPTAPAISVGDRGSVAGRGFTVGGRLQLDHGAGPWDEWYVGFDDGGWAWLAQGQGRWTLTWPLPAAELPAIEALTPGARTTLRATGDIPWTVVERGASTLLSAEGELPFPAQPGARGRYCDLQAPGGQFATLDYGDGREAPQLFVGQQVPYAALGLTRTGYGARPDEQVAVQSVACPHCAAPISLRRPQDTEHFTCESCGALLDRSQGALALVEEPEEAPFPLALPLGAEGTLQGEVSTVIGALRRSTDAWDETYCWDEYLLYTPKGYRWLLHDSGHWTLLSPVSAADVRPQPRGAVYGGRYYRTFATVETEVVAVQGEFYWKVERGDTAVAADFIAPPYLLSCERTDTEQQWSAGQYLEPEVVWRAFERPGTPPRPVGVAPAQPNPHSIRRMALAFAVLLGLLITSSVALGAHKQTVFEATLPMRELGDASAPEPIFSEPFTIDDGPTTLHLELSMPLDNGWVSVDTALINEATGEVHQLPLLAEHYQGVTDGQAWSEGSRRDSAYIGQLPSGRYTLRLVPSWAPYPKRAFVPPPRGVRLRAVQGERSPACFVCSLLLLGLPVGFRALRYVRFEARRKEGSNA